MSFGLYAQVYDLIYEDKDYAAEAHFVADVLRRFLGPAADGADIIDLACGTGRHLFELAGKGFKLTGNDLSPQMVRVAKESSSRLGLAIPFHQESFQTCARIVGKFDVALILFASAGYLTTASQVSEMLRNVGSLLKPGGIIILDVWNGLAVLRQYSPVREKSARRRDMRVRRVSTTELDELHHVARISFDFSVIKDDATELRFNERHCVRFFFPQEFADILEKEGYRVLLRCPFLDSSRDITPSDWNMTFVVRRN